MDFEFGGCGHLVVDNGSYKIKVGLSGDDYPSAEIPSLSGRSSDDSSGPLYVGNEAQSKRGVLSLSYPRQRGIVENWNDMEALWRHIFAEHESHSSILWTERHGGPLSDRQTTIKHMFETFNFNRCLAHEAETLALYASGQISFGDPDVIRGSSDQPKNMDTGSPTEL